MEVVTNIKDWQKRLEGSVVTVGNFDGLHIGHQEIIKRVLSTSKGEKLPSVVFTFEPHPMKILQPSKGFSNIEELDQKLERLRLLGLDYAFVEPFSRGLSELSSSTFFNEFLVKKLGAKFLYVGYDFSFGRDRSGTLDFLKTYCDRTSVKLEVVDAVQMNGKVISSSLIRKLIREGKVEQACDCLGRPFQISGIIKKGAGRGKKLGVPTANLETKNELLPQIGVYVTETTLKTKKLRSVTNVGRNPTFEKDGKEIHIETHILNFDQDLYGEKLTVDFLSHLRPEMKFDSVEDLIRQMKVDIEAANKYEN